MITIPLEEYNLLKHKEFVYDYERARRAERISKGSYVDTDDKILYGLSEPVDALTKIREKLEEEKEDW